jgi:outer membrane protein TolC
MRRSQIGRISGFSRWGRALRFPVLVFLVAGPGPAVLAEEARQRLVSVWDAITIARQNSPDLEHAAARIREAEAAGEQARSAYYPTVFVDTGYLRSNAPSVVFGKTLDQRALDFPNVNFNDPDAIDNFESGAGLRYGLFSPGRKQQNQAASRSLAAERLGRAAAENELIDAVVKAYYTVLETDEMIRTAEASTTTIESELRDARSRFTGGAALETDVLSLEVRLAGANERLIRSRNARRLAISALANVMGLPADTPVQLSGEEWKPRELPANYEAGLQEAVRLRPELQQIREHVQSARLNEAAATRSYLPRVDAVARGYLDAEDLDYALNDGNWLLGLTLSVDVFDGHLKRAKVRQARAMLGQLTASEKKLLQGVQLEVKQAYIRYEEAQERVKVTSAAVQQAEKVLEQVKKQFEGGAATVTRYLEAELDLTQARSRATAARYDVKKSMAEVGRSVGYCVTCAREASAGKE